MQILYERCAGIDIGKDIIAVAVRMPGEGPDGRKTVKRTFKTFYGVLRECARWLTGLGVTHVAMEATGIYSMPVYQALNTAEIERLEAAIDRWNEELGPLENFILPGGSALIAQAHPDWTPESDGWEADVACFALVEAEALVLIDPLVPADDEERFWNALALSSRMLLMKSLVNSSEFT